MVTVSATERPQGQQPEENPPDPGQGGNGTGHDSGQPNLILPDKPREPGSGRGVAGRGHQSWASRFESGQGSADGEPRVAMGRGAGWEVFSYLIAGMLAYGGLGWVIGHYTHIQILFPIGMLIGIAISLGWIVYKYGRP